jgi:hypothetical protein
LAWKELLEGRVENARVHTLATVHQRVAQRADPWEGWQHRGVAVAVLRRKLEALSG